MSDDEKDEELWALFGSVRAHVVDLAQDFADRVSARIDDYIETGELTRPSLTGMMASFVLDVTNMLSAAVGPKRSTRQKTDDGAGTDENKEEES